MSGLTEQEEQIAGLVADLKRAADGGSFERVASTADKILQLDAEDEDAIRFKLVALIKQSAFAKALKLMDEHAVIKNNRFERAYCYFRLNKLDDAAAQLDKADGTLQPVQELKAQMKYRQEQFKDASEIYTQLAADQNEDGFEAERSANLLAAHAGIASLAEDPSSVALEADKTAESYEEYYNMACIALSQARYQDAAKFLEQSMESCRTMLGEDPDVTEEEIDDELAILRVQMGVALQGLGKPKESMENFTQAMKSRPDDAVLCAVASMNIVALNKDKNVFDSRKKMERLKADAVANKLTTAQTRLVAQNQALLQLHMNQANECRKQLDEMEKLNPDSDVPILIRAALLVREKKVEESQAALKDYVKSHPSSADRIKLTIAQTCLQQGQIDASLENLANMETIKHQPGMVGTFVKLFTFNEDVPSACNVLESAVKYWQSSSLPYAQAYLGSLRRATADFKFSHGMYEDAGALYKEIFEANTEDGAALTRLIACTAEYDIEAAEQYGEQLPPVEYSEGQFDLDKLEKDVMTRPRRTKAAPAPEVAKAADEPAVSVTEQVAKPKRRRKKRPGKLPQDYNPAVAPDPERWLPKYERSEYKRKHRKRAGLHYQVARGTQGSETPIGGAGGKHLKVAGSAGSVRSAASSASSLTSAGNSASNVAGGEKPAAAEKPKPEKELQAKQKKTKKKKKKR